MSTYAKKMILAQLGATLTALLLVGVALAQSLSLMAPSLANVHGRLTTRFGVAVEEQSALQGELEDGSVMVLTCRVLLSEANNYWFDHKISQVQFRSVLKFDPLTREYSLSLPDRETLLRNKDLKQLLDDGWGTLEASLGPWTLLDRGKKYSLRLQTSMNEQGAPEGIMSYIYFWSWDAGANNTFKLDFTF